MFKNKLRIIIVALIFICIGVVVYIFASRKTSINENEADNELENHVKYKIVEPTAQETIWEKNSDEEIEMDIETSGTEDKYTLQICNGENTYIYVWRNKSYFLEINVDEIDAITGIKVCDINFDGRMELLLNVVNKSKQMALVYVLDEQDFGFEEYLVRVPESLYDYNLPYTVDDIELLLTNGKINGDFKSCKEAYKYIVNLYTNIVPASYLEDEIDCSTDYNAFDLVYLDDDNIPELVVGTRCRIMIYSYNGGSVSRVKDEFADYYDHYCYIPRESLIEAVLVCDEISDENYTTYYKYSNTELEPIYTIDKHYEEYDYVEQYFNNNDEKIDKRELIKEAKKYSEMKYTEFKMEDSSSEILEELEKSL